MPDALTFRHIGGVAIKDERHWLDRSEEMRALAEQVGDAQARASLLRVADEYLEMARARRR